LKFDAERTVYMTQIEQFKYKILVQEEQLKNIITENEELQKSIIRKVNETDGLKSKYIELERVHN